MFELEKSYPFDAGHAVKTHMGKCAQPHGHSFVITVRLRSQTLKTSGPQSHMVMDFQEISDKLRHMVDTYFDHRWLNDTLQTDSPTVEFIARWAYEFLKPSMPLLHSVTIQEGPTSRVTYWVD